MTGLAIYKLLFMTELLVAEALFSIKMPRRSHFWARAIAAVVICYGVAFFYPIIDEVAYTGWYVSLMFIALFATSLLGILFVYRISFANAFFCAVTAYTVQHLAYGLVNTFFSLFGDFDFAGGLYGKSPFDFSRLDAGSWIVILSYFNIFAMTYTAAYYLLGPYFRRAEGLKIKSLKLLVFAALIFLIDVVLNAFTLYDNETKTLSNVINIYNMLSCAFVFYVQFSMVATKEMTSEISNVTAALRQAQKQYELQKENIKIINNKCHDLKYQIGKYADKNGMDEETIDEIKKIVSIYDSTVNTGNEVIDIILTEKNLLCNSKNIKLTCMVDDCRDLNFIREGDLYALFGNIVDNSIEAVTKLGDPNKRCIGLNIHTVKRFVSISIDNYYDGKIKFAEDGLPKTTKEDENYHGYGIRSVASIVSKYNGVLHVKTDDNVFTLSIMFPINGERVTEKAGEPLVK